MQKTIIITGASSGIGRALAEHLAALNHNIFAVGRNKKALDELAFSYPANIKIIVADLTEKKDLLKIKNAVNTNDRGLFLVNNAGIANPKFFADVSEEEWDEHYLTNTKAVVFLTQLLLPNLNNGGRVLNISTGLAHYAISAFAAYGVSKAAILMWKEYANIELNDQGIIFGSAMPGIVDTPMQEKIRHADSQKFPIVKMFEGFKEHDELLSPKTAAKFLAWLLFEVSDNEFKTGDWNINDTSHHQHWAKFGEVKKRI